MLGIVFCVFYCLLLIVLWVMRVFYSVLGILLSSGHLSVLGIETVVSAEYKRK